MSPETAAHLQDKTSGAYLLPGFEEYLLGYKDRSAVLDHRYATQVVPGSNGIFKPVVVENGRITGTWKRVIKKDSVAVAVSPFEPLDSPAQLAAAAKRYSDFLGLALAPLETL
jgi:hypothetical protein